MVVVDCPKKPVPAANLQSLSLENKAMIRDSKSPERQIYKNHPRSLFNINDSLNYHTQLQLIVRATATLGGHFFDLPPHHITVKANQVLSDNVFLTIKP